MKMREFGLAIVWVLASSGSGFAQSPGAVSPAFQAVDLFYVPPNSGACGHSVVNGELVNEPCPELEGRILTTRPWVVLAFRALFTTRECYHSFFEGQPIDVARHHVGDDMIELFGLLRSPLQRCVGGSPRMIEFSHHPIRGVNRLVVREMGRETGSSEESRFTVVTWSNEIWAQAPSIGRTERSLPINLGIHVEHGVSDQGLQRIRAER